MAKIICITSGLTGILNASFELVARLTVAGHQVTYASPGMVADRVASQGIPFIQLPAILQHPGPELPPFKGPLKKIARLAFKIKNATQRRKQALEKLYPFAFSEMLREQTPDLLIIDMELHEYIIKAYSEKTPTVLLSQWFSVWKRKGLPSLLYDTIPGKGWKGQPFFLQFSWWWIRRQRWWTFKRQQLYTFFTDRRTILLDLAQKEAFPSAYIRENYWPGPFSYDQLPVISMTAAELEFPHDWRPSLYYIGPMVYENRVDLPASQKNRYSLEDVLEYRRKINASLIYCTVSTLHQGDRAFIEKLTQAVKKRKDWVLIIGMGGLIEEEKLGQLPGNVFAFSAVPQLEVLRQSDCSVNHGGIHTINECIHFKVPMLIYSGKRSDQNGCAARVAYHGLGIMADKDRDSPEEIREKIKKVLSEVSFRQGMEKMYLHYQKYKEDQIAEKTIDHLLTSKTGL